MTTLTETMVDVADCRTTLYYLSKNPPADSPLQLGTKSGYQNVHSSLPSGGSTAYDQLVGKPGEIINRLSHVYQKNKYWRRFTGDDDFPFSIVKPWDTILPLEASLKSRVEFVNNGNFKFKVSPLPTVLIYPFGWSTWLSFRLTSAHSLSDLSAFVQYLFNNKAFKVDDGQGGSTVLSLREYFATIAAGIRADVFGDKDTNDKSYQQFVLVATVIAKHGGSPSLKLLTPEEKLEILRIVKPEGPPPKKDFESYIHPASPNDPLQFVIANDLGRFIWLEHLLKPVGPNRVWLNCHHNNTARSLIHALHLHRLISASGSNKQNWPEPLLELLQASSGQLSSPGYKNLSLQVFLATEEVKASIEKVANLT